MQYDDNFSEDSEKMEENSEANSEKKLTKNEYVKKMMEDWGYEVNQEEVCSHRWCQDMDECLWVSLQRLQNDLNNGFFDGQLKEDDMLVKESFLKNVDILGCSLPEIWYEQGSMENGLINFVLDVFQTLAFYNISSLSLEELIYEEDLRGFAKNIYMFLSSVLNAKFWPKKEEAFVEIEKFLTKNEVFEEQDNEDFLRTFRKFAK